ncbi:MAG: alpha-amylase family glycosyl hydrolase, partial [Acidobacteriaceae bacterium]|nr:alpha-amylase family glycosyl hydrolase [Acidobacteriaceae bacterium]
MKTGTLFALLPSFPLMALQEPAEKSAIEASLWPANPSQPAAPEWIKDLVIYEIATKGFTSPKGPESGTFASLKARLPYLQELGVNGIWLAGYSLCDPHHFYNIWTQYAVIEPDKFDPALGTAEEFKSMIDDAHSRGIKVFLDVITHGLLNGSPVIRQHPSWFRGGSWGMTDFDWGGGHKDLDDWWVRIYTDYVVKYGVDGYRLDVAIQRPDLWQRIRMNAAAAGHPIVIWEENNAALRGVTDFEQHEYALGGNLPGDWNKILTEDMPGFYDRMFGRAGYYEAEIRYRDGEVQKGNTRGEGPVTVRLMGLAAGRVSRRTGEGVKTDGLPNVRIRLGHVAKKPIANLTIRNDAHEQWQFQSEQWYSRPLFVDFPEADQVLPGPDVDVLIATQSYGAAVQISCHDNGWEGFPLDSNPYVAQGRRSVFGYAALFSPMIPIFFSGEEFNADFHPLPNLSPALYGDKDAGKGRWLYGAMLDWNELNDPGHKDMFLDVQKMISIRRQHSSVLGAAAGAEKP